MERGVRLGIIGAGSMGRFHADYLMRSEVNRCELVAMCDSESCRLAEFAGQKPFTDITAMMCFGEIDAVLIATPHYFHTAVGIEALKNELHVMVEKPLSVHKADCERLIAAHTNPKQVFAAMFQQRTFPRYRRIREMVQGGELGEINRINWTITDWFRTEAYYASAKWRGTWKGEGGGVLINQCPHNLDLLQWIFGMPKSVRAFCKFGAKHDIEVEDEVTAYLEWQNGATGVFITSTGEAPGTNRLEICGDRGRLLMESGNLQFACNEVPASEYSRTDETGFAAPPVSQTETRFDDDGRQHVEITQNFVDAILDGVPLIAPAEEAALSVELANSMVYSTLVDRTVELPLDAAAYEEALNKLIRESTFEKKGTDRILDMTPSIRR